MSELSETPPKSTITVEQAEELGKIQPKAGMDFADQIMPGVNEEIDRLEHEDPNDPRVAAYYRSFRESGLNTPIDILRAANPISPKIQNTLDSITGKSKTKPKKEK